MFKNYIKIAFRNLQKNKTFSFINILGFAFAISICLGITAYLLHEYSFDTYHKNANRIYRLIDTQDNSSSIDYRVKDILVNNYPEIEKGCLFQLLARPVAVTVNNQGKYIENILSADNAFFEIFTIPLLRGNREKPLSGLNSVILTESTAKQLFGEENPMGKEIKFENRIPLTVTGIIKDFPDNSSIQANMIVNAVNDAFKFSFHCERYDDPNTHRWPFRIYFLLNEKANDEVLTEKINSHRVLYPYEERVSFLSLHDLYLHDNTHGSRTKQGNAGLLNLLLSIGLIILVLAIINYINLTAAQQHRRYKEIGIKKSMGVTRRDILIQFLTESVLVSCISFIIGILFLTQCIPIYRSIFYNTFTIYHLTQYIFLIIPSVILLGIVSGFSTAYLFSSIHPVQALKGELFTRNSSFSWRNGLIIFQFTVAIALIFCIIVIHQQIYYVKHKNPGFDKEQLLKLDLPNIHQADKDNAFLLMNRYRQFHGIKSISMTSGIPGHINNRMGANMPGKSKSLPIIYADSSFLETFGITIIEGRYPLPGDFGTTCLINEAAFKYFEWINLDNKRYDNGREGGFEVIGVVNDFHHQSLRGAIEPMCILLFKEFYPSHLSIRIASGQIRETLQFIRKTWQEILPQYPLEYGFYDSWLDAMYREDDRLGTTIGLFALLAIVISCLGVLGMAIFSTQKRTKEIGIRKVIGASVPSILVLLTRNFTGWVLLANIIAWPVAWYAMNQWLQNFVYRINISFWYFIFAGLMALIIALLTVSWQTYRAATANPVDSLRYE